MRKISGQTVYVLAVLVGSSAPVAYVFLFEASDPALTQVRGSSRTLEQIPFDGAAAYKSLQELCDIGPRVSGSAGMAKQQKLLTDWFEKQGAKVERQGFRARHPLDGSAVALTNLIVHWHPERKERLLVATHYDTRPFPDQDPVDKRGKFLGANDGTSGVALLMQLGTFMPKLSGKLGVDFVLFDGEELVYNANDEYFLGSRFFSEQYVAAPPAHRYRAGVLLDMVGDAQLQCFYEPNSIRLAPTVARSVWDTARKLGVREFIPQMGRAAVNDDHIPLNEIAHIPTCDVIDFDYPYWHTQGDLPARCSALSLAKVGWVMHEWLQANTAR